MNIKHLGRLRFLGKGKGVMALLAFGALAVGYNDTLSYASTELFGSDAGITKIIRNIPDNVDELIAWTKEKLGSPRAQFGNGMDSFINVAHEFNPNATAHPQYNRIYETMDMETFAKKVKDRNM